HCNQTVRDINELFRFELAQAMGANNPLPYLAGDIDIAIAAPGLPLVFSRSFSSSISDRFEKGTLGKGWSHAWQTLLAEDAEGNVIVTSMNRERRYQPDDRGGYFSPPGDYSILSKSGDVFTLTFAGGIIQRFRADGKLDYLEDLNGNRITAEYSSDLLSRLVHSAGQYLSFTYTGGLISTISDHTRELTVDFAYDLFGDQLTSVTDILGRTTNYLYSQTGASAYAMAGIDYPDNTEERFNYDENGRLSETVFNSSPQASFSYDLGAVTMTANADNSSHGFYYDAKGQLVKYVDPLGGATVSAFDNNYNLLRVVGPDGLSASLAYDRKGNTTTVTDALGQLVKIGYGDFNRMSSITDAAVNTTDFYYDSQGNNDSVTYPDSSQKVYSFDFLGNLTQRTNRRGSAVGYSYDSNGFVLQKTYDDGTTVSYSYDEVGNITSVTDLTGTTTFTYYENHLLQRITNPRNLFLEYTYDSLGRRSSVIDQSGYKLQYAYNAYGQLESIVQGEGQLLVNYTYDSMRRLSVKTLGNGVSTTYEYDLAGRLIHLVNYAADDSILSRFDYEFDARGRRTSMSTLDANWVYTYDKVGQLVEAAFTSSHSDIADKSIIYTYDKAGNRTQEIFDGSSIDYVPNNMNQYSQAGNAIFNYDNDGNLISKIIGSDVWQYSYNDDNKLVAVLGPEGASEYQYDGLGNLTALTENGTTRYYLIDPTGFGNVVGEYDESGALLTRYTYGMGLISKDDYFYTFDGNGNTAELTNSLSEKTNSYAYAPFGEVLFSSESVNNEFQFVGQFGIRQAGNDLLYMRNRFYMPSTGRFISEDPIGIAGGLNLYGYVYNDAVNFVDPLGLTPAGVVVGAIAGGVSGAIAGIQSGNYVSGIAGGITGALVGAAFGAVLPQYSGVVGGMVGGAISGMFGGGAGGAVGAWTSGRDGKGIAHSANSGMVNGVITGALGGGVSAAAVGLGVGSGVSSLAGNLSSHSISLGLECFND
ncbi:MAG: RHS repeat protein, partial [Deltaproteobacteria bacterium]|nr:RHS repeat protein [Candidatus Desulfobacula maris]